MTVKTRKEIEGLEYDWLASDADGHVAFFSTAGGGYAPDGFLRDIELHDGAIAELLAARPTTDALFAPAIDAGLQNTWKLMAERGLFAFDSDPTGGPYRLVAAPRRSAHVFQLPTSVSAAALVLNLRFASINELSMAALTGSSAVP